MLSPGWFLLLELRKRGKLGHLAKTTTKRSNKPTVLFLSSAQARIDSSIHSEVLQQYLQFSTVQIAQ